ncbi:Na+-dependent transporter [Sphingomonas cavernae]|uniref:Na+-dependent transporter n=1 Tax=Sphingomonas cavernae TaxID=2320861 RepID=A0A418WM80_9SPHN|nr:Na+-dependent transporter [Sphingomonas cavernae]RJF91108.1 Na+-dependent transporter [Sphingomonas cavernae]
MELIKQFVPILLTGSLALLVVSIGLGSKHGELLYVFQRPGLLARGILAVSIIPLVAAILIVTIFPISLPAKAGIILMAISPVPPLVPGKMLKFGGRSEYAYGLYAAMALLAIITVPLLGLLVSHYFDVKTQFPISVVARNVFVGLIVPVSIGLMLGRWLAPEFSHRVAPIVAKVALGLVLLAFVPILAGSWPSMVTLIGDGTLVAIIIVVVIAIAGGHFLGGETLHDKSTLAFAAAMRHPGIALALAGANHLDKRVSGAVLLVLIVGVVTLIPYQIMIRRLEARS